MTRIEDLSDDDLLGILSQLNLKNRAAAEMVCKRWQRLIQYLPPINVKISFDGNTSSTGLMDDDSNLSMLECSGIQFEKVVLKSAKGASQLLMKNIKAKAVCIEVISAAHFIQFLPIFINEFTNLQHLELKFADGFWSDSYIDMLANVCKESNTWGVNSMAGGDFSSFTWSALSPSMLCDLFESCVKLESVILECNFEEHFYRRLVFPPKLKSLLLRNVDLTDRNIAAFVSKDVKLRELAVNTASSNNLYVLSTTMGKSLTSLEVRNVRIRSPKTILVLSLFPNLVSLDIGFEAQYPMFIDDNLTEGIHGCPKLQRLHLFLTKCITSSVFVQKLPGLCPDIKDLLIQNDYESSWSIGDPCLLMMPLLTKLESLVVPYAAFTAKQLSLSISECHSLTTLVVQVASGDMKLIAQEMATKALLKPNVKHHLHLRLKSMIDTSTILIPDNLKLIQTED